MFYEEGNLKVNCLNDAWKKKSLKREKNIKVLEK